LEISYKSNGEITANLIKSKGPFTLRIDQNGSATLSGKAGTVRFSVKNNVSSFGVDLKYVGVFFSGTGNGKIVYRATFKLEAADFKAISITYSSFLDLEKLILSCSGLLCQAAKHLKNRFQKIDRSIQEATQ